VPALSLSGKLGSVALCTRRKPLLYHRGVSRPGDAALIPHFTLTDMKLTSILLWGGIVSALSLTSCDKQSPAPGSGGGAAKVLRFSAIPNQNATELKSKFDPMAAHLSKELGVTVEFFPSVDYKASVEAFKNGQVQLAWFGGVTGVQARHAVPGAKAIVQGKEDTAFKSYFIAHKDTGLEASETFPAGLGGMKFAFGSETSTSGRVMPSWYIKQNSGKSEKEFFAQPPVFTGSHDKTVEQVAAGVVQAGVCDYSVYDKLMAEKKVDPDAVKVIWVTPAFPDYNFTVHPSVEADFGAGFTSKLQAALIAMTEKAPDLLKVFPRSALIEAKDDDYKPVEDVCRELGIIR
jgi:phosphonate transport system substrate-binding protein